MQRMHVNDENYEKLESFINKRFISFQKDILESAKKFNENYSKEVVDSFIKWMSEPFLNVDDGRNYIKNTLTLLTDPAFLQAYKDGIFPPLQPIFQYNLLGISSFPRLKDQDVLQAIRNNTLPIKEIMKWSDSELWQRFSLFHREKFITQKRYYLLDRLCYPNITKALNEKLIDINKVKALAEIDMEEATQLLDTLNLSVMDFILTKSISFDQIYELAWRHGAKQVTGFIRSLSDRESNFWLQKKSDLTPHDILQAALNYDGDLIALTQKVWYAKDEELYDVLRNESRYVVMRM